MLIDNKRECMIYTNDCVQTSFVWITQFCVMRAPCLHMFCVNAKRLPKRLSKITRLCWFTQCLVYSFTREICGK